MMSDLKQKNIIIREQGQFKIDGMAMPYAEFVPRLFNFCISLGFRKGFIMPSRAFCSDESQGLPIILLTKHFGTFPFNHGIVGGIMATDRHGPHAAHGEDAVILQASHIGYDPDTGIYGKYRRPHVISKPESDACGKITHVITPYLKQYEFAKERIFLRRGNSGSYQIIVKNSFIDFTSHKIKSGLVLSLEKIVHTDRDNIIRPLEVFSASHAYEVTEEFRKKIDSAGYIWKSGHGESIGEFLTGDLFYFREELHERDESILLERNLIEFMPWIVTSKSPQLAAATTNIQLEFARTVESIRMGKPYAGKNLLYIAGLNIDISEYLEYPPTTYFVPWAAHINLVQDSKRYIHPLEQDELMEKLCEQSIDNPAEDNIKEKIDKMMEAPRFDIRAP